MKKQVLFVAMVALLMGLTSCHKEDLNLLRSPYRVQGEIDPGFSLPIIGAGQMNFGDLLSKFDGSFSNILLDDTLITFHYDTIVSTRLDIGNMMSKRHVKRVVLPRRTKSDPTYITVDTVISYPLDVDLFKKAEFADLLEDSISIEHLWLNLQAYVFGGCPDTLRENLRQYSTISIDQLSLRYTGHDGVEHDFDGNSSLTDSLVIHDIIEGDSVKFTNVNLASIINSLPQQVVATFHLNINVDEQFLFTIMDTAVAHGQFDFSGMLDSLDFSWLQFDIKLSLDFPFEIRIGNLTYDYTLPINSNASNSENGETMRISEMIDKIKSELNEHGIALDLDTLNNLVFEFDNDIPLNIMLNADFVDEGGSPIANLFSDGVIASAYTAPISGNTTVHEAVGPKTSRVKVPLSLDILDNINKAKGVKMSLGLSTEGPNRMAIKKTDFMNIKMKIQLHPSITVDMPLFN